MTPNLKLREIVEANRVGDFWATRQIEKVARVFAKWVLKEFREQLSNQIRSYGPQDYVRDALHDVNKAYRAIAAKLDGGEE